MKPPVKTKDQLGLFHGCITQKQAHNKITWEMARISYEIWRFKRFLHPRGQGCQHSHSATHNLACATPQRPPSVLAELCWRCLATKLMVAHANL